MIVTRYDRIRAGLTLVEVLVVAFILCMLVLLLLPNIRMPREAARRTQCTNNMKRLSLAMLNYEAANSKLPIALGEFDDHLTVDDPKFRRLSGMISLLPFMEEDRLFDIIANPSEFGGVSYPAMGPVPWNAGYEPWTTQVAALLCPSAPEEKHKFGVTNYAFCIGDTVSNIHKPITTRGAFGCRQSLTLSDIKDGASKTIAFGEIGTSSGKSPRGGFLVHQPIDLLQHPQRCVAAVPADPVFGRDGRGGRWADGSAGYSLFNTVLPPNSPSCAVVGEDMADGIYSAASFHSGDMVNVAMMDGSVRRVAGSIDASGESDRRFDEAVDDSPSPFGVWGAMGTVAGAESYGQDPW